VNDRSADGALLAALHAEGLDTVAGALDYPGGQDFVKPGLGQRRRTKLTITDGEGVTHELYLKRYGCEGWADRLRRRWTYGRGASAGGVELANVRTAEALGVTAMHAVACGASRGQSYVIVTAASGDALERCFSPLLEAGEVDAVAAVTLRLAELVRKLHRAGFAHRDLYASHVFLDRSAGAIRLGLIDLARMFRPRIRRFRWFVKDLAQLKYSMPPAWVDDWWGPFLDAYLSEGIEPRRRWAEAVDRRLCAMRRRQQRHAARGSR
jgi:hypothetical protein